MTNSKDYASTLWNNLSEGLETIYQKYKSLRASSQKDYDAQINALTREYDQMRNSAHVQSRIAKSNLEEKLANNGLGASGEGLKRSLLQDAALQQNLTDLNLSEQAEKQDLSNKKQIAEDQYSAEESSQVAQYIYQMNQAYFDQLNTQKDQALEEEKLRLSQKEQKNNQTIKEKELAQKAEELRLKAEQQAFEQSIEQALTDAKLKEYEQKASSGSSSGSTSGSSSGTSSGTKSSSGTLGFGGSKLLQSQLEESVTPDSYDAKELVQDLVKQNTTTDYRGADHVDLDLLRTRLNAIIQNTAINTAYRYEVYLYAKSMGYLS